MAPSDEHQSLLELLAKVAEGNLQQNLQMQKLTENMNQMAQSVTSSRIEKRPVLQNCPKMKKGENLETWIQEVTLWDKTVTGEEALKYLKFREMVKDPYVCPDVKKFVKAKIADNEAFKKDGDVIKRALEAIKKGLGKTDLEKSNEAWNTFVDMKQAEDETPKDYVNRFEESTTALENAGMKQKSKTLAIHLLRSSKLTEASKENILAKVDMNDHEEIFSDVSKAMREIKTMTSKSKEDVSDEKKKEEPTETYFSRGNRRGGNRYRSSSRDYRDSRDYSSRRRDSRDRYSGRSSSFGRSGSFRDNRRDDRKEFRNSKPNESDDRNSRRNEGNNRNRYNERQRERSGSRRFSPKETKPWRKERASAQDTDFSEQVHEVHYAPYDDNLELIKAAIDNDYNDVEDAHTLDKKARLIETIYKEGNNDVDPTIAIIDTGCPRTVAGKPWLDSYIQTNEQQEHCLKFRREKTKFRFGNGPVYISERSWKIEVSIGKLKTAIWVAVVDADVPLLLGLDYQEKWGIVLDVQEGTLSIKSTGETFKVKTLRKNHWKLKLQQKTLHEEATNLVLNVTMTNMKRNDLKKHIMKVHKNLGHKSKKQLLLLFKMAEQDDKKIRDMIEEVTDECTICRRYKKTPPRPKIAMAKASTSNEVVSLDLKEFNKENKYILYMVDEFSNYVKGEVINNKKPETIIKAFNKAWVEDGPGIPSKGTMTDNGGEFKNPEFKEMAAKYGLKVSLTAGNSPWSN